MKKAAKKQEPLPLREGDCIHGYGRYQCAVCYHPKGACSFGHCQKPATVRVNDGGDIREMCDHDAAWIVNHGGIMIGKLH